MTKNKKVLLMILDGWGIGDGSKSDAIANSNLPYIQSLINKAHCKLLCSGEDVGLPEGQMGNSEVGHLNIGAGRVVYQDLVKINKAIKDKSIKNNPVIIQAFKYAKENNKQVHFLGLVSEGGVHSSMKHLYGLCDIAKDYGINNCFIHAFTDGRDTDPESGLGYIKELQEYLSFSAGKIATVMGRYYAMDRDKRWERIKVAYDALVKGIGEKTEDVLNAVKNSYNNGVTDEFIKPIIAVDKSLQPLTTIKEGDLIICFNFRTDRCREITHVLSQNDMIDFGMNKFNKLFYVTMTQYDHSFKDVHIIFEKDDLAKTLGEVLSQNGKKQIRIAETEKYPHVTFFFSGGREKEFENEKRIMIPSPKVATYDLKPSMSAFEVRDAIIPEIKKHEADFICLNFANADMVGHTGIYKAIVEALETVDKCVHDVAEEAIKNNYTVIITADHGNADYAINEDGSSNTAHSTNPVPCFLIDKDFKSIKDGALADLAPTILSIMGLKIPSEMTGKILI
ncbi:MAG: 2,3-bisphosphoglycerate-independent phosphoglycerate mutase [Bacteroidota bacterium]|nr:2,3-bisphosphoglycerate-independent phosphoglycerate mutase [Bacteroidota bacterium]